MEYKSLDTDITRLEDLGHNLGLLCFEYKKGRISIEEIKVEANKVVAEYDEEGRDLLEKAVTVIKELHGIDISEIL